MSTPKTLQAQPADGAFIKAQAGDDGSPPSVSGVAYTGGKLVVANWPHPVVVDLEGLTIEDTVRLDVDHSSRVLDKLGDLQAGIEGNTIKYRGQMIRKGPAAETVLAHSEADSKLEVSIDARVQSDRFVGSRESVTINEQTFDGPIFVAEKSHLRAISIVTQGAEQNSSLDIAAERNNPMGDENTDVVTEIREQEAAESKRISAVKSLCAEADLPGGKAGQIESEAIEAGWDAERTELAILRARRPRAGVSVQAGNEAPSGDVLAAAAMLHAGKHTVAERRFDERTVQQADDLALTSMVDFCRACLRADGVEPPRNQHDMIRAAFSTVSLPVALGDAQNKIVQDAYAITPSTWESFASIKPAADFKDIHVIRPSLDGTLEEVANGGELKHTRLSEDTSSFSVGTYGKVLQVSRTDIVNDDAGVIEQAAERFGRMARRSLNDLVWQVILNNAGSFFSSGNDNLLTGADSALDSGSLADAIAAMRSQRDEQGNDLDIVPAVLAVCPELEVTGRELLTSAEKQAAEGEPSGNGLQGSADLEVEARISNTDKFDNASATAWYLFAGPEAMPVVVGFLNGNQSPTVEYMGVESQVNVLAAAWRVYFDYGAMLNDPKAAVRSDGA